MPSLNHVLTTTNRVHLLPIAVVDADAQVDSADPALLQLLVEMTRNLAVPTLEVQLLDQVVTPEISVGSKNTSMTIHS